MCVVLDGEECYKISDNSSDKIDNIYAKSLIYPYSGISTSGFDIVSINLDL